MQLNELSDDDLLSRLQSFRLDARHIDARVIAHLVEVEERRLHLTSACSSLFDFCVRRLGMSEGAAFRRITAARRSDAFRDCSATSRAQRYTSPRSSFCAIT
jgi:hypothetical protein